MNWQLSKLVHRNGLLAGWFFHLILLVLFGFYQETMRAFLDCIFNTPLMWLFHGLNTSFFTPVFMAANKIGEGIVVVPTLLLLLAISLYMKQKIVIYRLLSFSAGLSLMVGIAKKLMISARPQLWPYLETLMVRASPAAMQRLALG